MLKVILQAPRHISPFNEAARDLRIHNKPLWLNQRDLLAPYVAREIELAPGAHLPVSHEPMIVYRDNLFFDEHYITEFMHQARKQGARIVTIDPYRSRTAARSDWHVQPRVGTDADLARGCVTVLHVLHHGAVRAPGRSISR